MVSSKVAEPQTQGHVLVYARSARWRRSVSKMLATAGHSHFATAEPSELRRLLLSQRFDLLALNVRDEADARGLAEALQGTPLPPHSILSGSGSALPLIQQSYRHGTLRYSPGQLPPEELRRLVDASLSAGTWLAGPAENGGPTNNLQEVDLEEMIENAAAQVYEGARRKRQRFRTLVEGPTSEAIADPVKLHRTFVSLLQLVVGLAPRGALVSVQARASEDDWTIRITAAAKGAPADGLARLADALRAEARALRSAYRDVSLQGGLLWVEVSRNAALGICLALPLAPRMAQGRSA